MNIILNSGYVIRNVKMIDSTKSPIGLFVWALKQAHDQPLTFDKLTIRTSQIAGIELSDGEYYPSNRQNSGQSFQVKDDDLPWNSGGN